MAYGTYQTRNPKAVHSPVRSIPLFRPAAAVLGPCPLFAAQAILTSARRGLVAMEAFYDRSRVTLGEANRAKPALRRVRQSRAMRQLNQARADVRRARKALAAAEAALLALTGEAV